MLFIVSFSSYCLNAQVKVNPDSKNVSEFHSFYISFENIFSHDTEIDTCGCTDLYQTYPNPTDDITTFSFYLGEENTVSLIIFDLRGNQVDLLINNEKFPKGVSYRSFSLKSLSIGIYEYQLITPNTMKTKKLIIAR